MTATNCTTHHACECREAEIERLRARVKELEDLRFGQLNELYARNGKLYSVVETARNAAALIGEGFHELARVHLRSALAELDKLAPDSAATPREPWDAGEGE